jgi:hypothetical protein
LKIEEGEEIRPRLSFTEIEKEEESKGERSLSFYFDS